MGMEQNKLQLKKRTPSTCSCW